MEEGRQYRMNPKVFQAASTGDSSYFESLIYPSSIHLQVTAGKNTVLHVALQFKKFEVVEKIVYYCPSLVYKTNSKGNTPLHVAAMVGTSSLVKFLIDHAKKLNVEAGGHRQLLRMVNILGKDTALHVAVRYGKFEIVKMLIKEDPELAKYVNKAGESALFLAVDKQRYDIAFYILSATSDCSYAGRHGMNVLHAIAIHTSSYSNKGNLVLVRDMEKQEHLSGLHRVVITVIWVINMILLVHFPKRLLDRIYGMEDFIPSGKFGTIPEDLVKEVMKKWPSTIEQVDDSGWTPLHIATHMGDHKFVKLLLKNDNSAAYVRNKEGLSALHIAAKQENGRHYLVIKELMKACPDMYELLDNKGRNVLHAAAESGGWDAFEFFEGRPELEGLVNEQDEEGNTPMHLAAIKGHYCIVHGLRGVHLNATNEEGFTAMDNILFTSKLHAQRPRKQIKLWGMGARLSLRGALLKMGIRNQDPRSKPELAGGNDMGTSSESYFWKRVSDTNSLVDILIATVTFTAAFTLPGGYIANGNDFEGLAVSRKKTAFRVFLVANALAFGFSTTSVFVHFLASATIENDVFHRKVARRNAFFTNWSIGALLVAFIAATYTVVPHSLGNAVAIILCCCLLSGVFFPLTLKKKEEKPDSKAQASLGR